MQHQNVRAVFLVELVLVRVSRPMGAGVESLRCRSDFVGMIHDRVRVGEINGRVFLFQLRLYDVPARNVVVIVDVGIVLRIVQFGVVGVVLLHFVVLEVIRIGLIKAFGCVSPIERGIDNARFGHGGASARAAAVRFGAVCPAVGAGDEIFPVVVAEIFKVRVRKGLRVRARFRRVVLVLVRRCAGGKNECTEGEQHHAGQKQSSESFS